MSKPWINDDNLVIDRPHFDAWLASRPPTELRDPGNDMPGMCFFGAYLEENACPHQYMLSDGVNINGRTYGLPDWAETVSIRWMGATRVRGTMMTAANALAILRQVP